MSTQIQKIKALLLSFGLVVVSFAAPLLVTQPVLAASKGTCLFEASQGVPEYTGACKTAFPSGKDAQGHVVSTSKCYDVSGQGSNAVAKAISCSDSRLSKDGQQKAHCEGNGGTYANGDCSYDHKDCSNDNACDPAVSGGNCSSVDHCDLISKYINPFVNFLAALVGVAVVISIIIGGIQYGSSAGDPSKVSAAKNRIRNAILALVTFLFLYALLNFLIPGGLL